MAATADTAHHDHAPLQAAAAEVARGASNAQQDALAAASETEPKTSTDTSDLHRSTMSLADTNSGDDRSQLPVTTGALPDQESYDDVGFEPSAIVAGSEGGGLRTNGAIVTEVVASVPVESPSSEESSPERRSYDGVRTPAMQEKEEANNTANGAAAAATTTSNHDRRKSVQVVLEKTDMKGRYVLTADDPQIREILRYGIEREANPSGKPRHKFRDMVFTRQFTTFDRQNSLSYDSPFRGFFTLFWLAMALMLLRVAARNYRDYGSVLGGNEIWNMMFERDVIVLGLTDGVMCAATAFGLLLQKAVAKGYLRWDRSGYIIEHVWQASYLGAVLYWTVYREWPWTHTIFIVLHSLVFLMKQHSYSFYNGYLSQVYRRKISLEQKLEQLEQMKSTLSDPTSPTSHTSPITTSFSAPNKSSPSEITNRSNRAAAPKLLRQNTAITSVAAAISSGQPLDADQLESFSDVIRSEISSLSTELRGKCSTQNPISYPNNLTLANFADWTVLPTLVYELEYPRQDHINWWYVAEKTAATFGVIWVMMVISQTYIYPPVAETVRMKEAGMSLGTRIYEFPWVVSDMLFPLLLEQLLTWYVIWECLLNVLAELTRFADRGFYGDWWNSVSWDQYARDWNRPVHAFLLRHVYHSSISSFHFSKSEATFATFLLSALVHELVMWCMFRKVRGYLFAMQLLQLPLVALSRTRLLKGRNVLGNVFFWVGLFVGPSFLTGLYLVV